MKSYLDCIPCFFKQALEAARLAGASPKTQKKILYDLAEKLDQFPMSSCPPEMARVVYGLVGKATGKRDPYKSIKQKSNKLALRLYGKFKNKVNHSGDRLLTAVELAIAGNIIDYGVKSSVNIGKEILNILAMESKVIKKEKKKFFNYPVFKKAVSKAKKILYLGDNAGETVFDRILIEEIKRMDSKKEIIYIVKEKPVINDALLEDAKICGIDKIAKIISSGLSIPGTVLRLTSKKFQKVFKNSDIIISKGQGNFEALSQEKTKPLFFLFMAKCPVVSDYAGCNLGDIILMYNKQKPS